MAPESHDQAQTQGAEHDLLASASIAARAGRVRHARSLLGLLLRQHPDNEQAWLELAHLYEIEPAPDTGRTKDCLQQALRINPQNRAASIQLRELEGQHTGPEPTAPAAQVLDSRTPSQSTLLSTLGVRGIYLLAACALVLFCTLVVLGGAVYESRPIFATRAPAYTPTPLPTATPTATPTPSISERAGQQIPLLEQAWNARDWPAAIDRLAQISALDANYPGLHAAQCDTYVHWAQDMERQCQFDRAYEIYRRAMAVCEDREDVYSLKAQALLYRSGRWRYEHERWPQAVLTLQELYDAEPTYAAGCQEPLADADLGTGPNPLELDVRSLLRDSLVASSQQYLEQDDLRQALQAAQAALELAPDDENVLQLLDTIQFKLKPPPTPTPRPSSATGKRIEINISQQRMYVWQGDTLLHNWVCSTGKSGSGTAAGRFRVQSKIPEAWAGQWSLRMPYWLGIYWAGTVENGIHALPINPDGSTLWAGYLGTPVSFGCIILSTENARTLYNWAEIGTPVWIHY